MNPKKHYHVIFDNKKLQIFTCTCDVSRGDSDGTIEVVADSASGSPIVSVLVTILPILLQIQCFQKNA